MNMIINVLLIVWIGIMDARYIIIILYQFSNNISVKYIQTCLCLDDINSTMNNQYCINQDTSLCHDYTQPYCRTWS